jgi:hypothetical protein
LRIKHTRACVRACARAGVRVCGRAADAPVEVPHHLARQRGEDDELHHGDVGRALHDLFQHSLAPARHLLLVLRARWRLAEKPAELDASALVVLVLALHERLDLERVDEHGGLVGGRDVGLDVPCGLVRVIGVADVGVDVREDRGILGEDVLRVRIEPAHEELRTQN